MWLCWRKRHSCRSRSGGAEMAAEQAHGPGTEGWRGRHQEMVEETGLGMFFTFRASFEDLPRDQRPLCVMLLENIALTFSAAFSFPASLSLLAVEHPLFWAGISGSCGPISDQQDFLKRSAISDQPGR